MVVIGAIALTLVVLVGGYIFYDTNIRVDELNEVTAEEELISDEEMETLYQVSTETVGSIEVPTEYFGVDDRDPIFDMERLHEVLQGSIETDINPQLMYDTFLLGYEVVKSDTPNEYFITNVPEEKRFVVVTFNEDETEIINVEFME